MKSHDELPAETALEELRCDAVRLAEEKLGRPLNAEERKGMNSTHSRTVLESFRLVFAAKATSADQVTGELTYYAHHPISPSATADRFHIKPGSGITYYKQRKIILLALLPFSFYAVLLGIREQELTNAAWFSAATIGPAVPYLLGLRWWRILVGCHSVLLLIPWAIIPMTLHSIERTVFFWLLWGVFGAACSATTWAAFQRVQVDEV